jgi:hypothetical protein
VPEEASYMTVEIKTSGKSDIYENATRFELVPDASGEDIKRIEVSTPGQEASYDINEVEGFKAY